MSVGKKVVALLEKPMVIKTYGCLRPPLSVETRCQLSFKVFSRRLSQRALRI